MASEQAVSKRFRADEFFKEIADIIEEEVAENDAAQEALTQRFEAAGKALEIFARSSKSGN